MKGLKNKSLKEEYLETRVRTLEICRFLEVEDYVIQAAPFVSPAKWHLAHTTWFFEEFILKKFCENFKYFNESYSLLFNSYYNSVGKFWPQSERGLLSRPTLSSIFGYREAVDELILGLCDSPVHCENEEFLTLMRIGLNHEQQHQELLHMDIKYNFSVNPLRLKVCENDVPRLGSSVDEDFLSFSGGVFSMGRDYDSSFCYDNETPRHDTIIHPFSISNKLVTNGEYLEFILSKDYLNHKFWFSDGYNLVKEKKQGIPLYWFFQDGQWYEYELWGPEKLNLNKPVQHISYYEASAYASWKGCRLPKEAEWELVTKDVDFNIQNLHESLWQWTSSPYSAYPGYKKPKGAIGEYNQKFMSNQIVLRGGCYRTPQGHYRNTYRNFFYPEQKWMFSGIRLVKEEE